MYLKDRFIKVVASLNLVYPVTEIAEKTGYTKGNVSEFLNKENKRVPSKAFILEFCEKFEIDYWKNFGTMMSFAKALEEGEIREGKKKEVIALGKHAPLRLKPDEYAAAFGDWPGLPMFNVPVTASFVETYRDEKIFQPQYYLHDPRFRDCQFGAIITGDSMHSEIRHGDFIACQEVTDMRFIVFGDIYYVVATNGLETCKYLNMGIDSNTLLLVPRNEKISPSPIQRDMIHKLYKVRGIIRGY